MNIKNIKNFASNGFHTSAMAEYNKVRTGGCPGPQIPVFHGDTEMFFVSFSKKVSFKIIK